MTAQSMTAQSMTAQSMTAQSMTGKLLRVLVCPPGNAGWNDARKSASWRDLGFHHAPDFEIAQCEHDALCRLLTEADVELDLLPASEALTLDAVYVHDASLPTDTGLILLNLGKPTRGPEARAHAGLSAQLDIPILGSIGAPACAEAGDMVWLDTRTLLVGHGYRTNLAGIEQLRALLSPKGIEVLLAPLPYGPGPSACLHLMSLMSMLDEATVLVDLPWLAVETVELLRARSFRLLEIDSQERDSLACNVLSLGDNRLIALQQNVKTNDRLRQAGFEVVTFPGVELCINGSGGPTCLTRPLRRGESPSPDRQDRPPRAGSQFLT